jgi:hypothetical protein
MQAVGCGVGEANQHVLAGCARKTMFRRFPDKFRTELISEDETRIIGKYVQRNTCMRRKEQAVARQPVIRPLPIHAKILDRGFYLDNPDLTASTDTDDIGSPARS